MKKIKERGKTYALHKASDKLNDYYGSAMLNVVQFDGHDIQCAYIDGYLKAEQDLEVKEDVVSTDTLANSLKISRNGNPRIEAMKEALRMEYEKGRADVLRDIKPEIDNHKTCGECGYYMPYVKTDGDKDSYGDCASIGMNNECFEGNNHFKDPDEELLQVEEKEKACGYFKVNRPVRVRKYIKDNPIYSNKRSKKQ